MNVAGFTFYLFKYFTCCDNFAIYSRQTENTGEEPIDERLKNIEPKMVELITNEIMDLGPSVEWDDIAGLEFAKKTVC